MMEKYFDAFLYFANWGTHWLMLRLPTKLADVKAIRQYNAGDSFTIWTKAGHVLLEFQSEDESGDWEEEGDFGRLASLISLRADLLGGDWRCLYLGWLASAQAGQIEEDEIEPPVPPGLKRLSASLKGLADFLRIDDKLLKAAAALDSSNPQAAASRADLSHWIDSLPPTEKNKILLRLFEGDSPHLREQLFQRFRQSHAKKSRPKTVKKKAGVRRTAGELPAAADLR